ELLPNGISVRQIDHALETATQPRYERYVLTLGKLHAVKGLERLLEAFADLPSRYSLRWVIAGLGIDTAYGRALVRRITAHAGLRSRVTLVGHVSGSKKWSLLRHAHAVWISSHTE